MGVIGGKVGYELLRRLAPGGGVSRLDGSAYRGKSKLRVLLGDDLLGRVVGKTVLDYGCGVGHEALEIADAKAARVIGLDIQEGLLLEARSLADRSGVAGKVTFVSSLSEMVDIVVCLDAFEHFAEPAQVMEHIASLLKPGGELLVSFGPPWFHPLGGHLFSVFPWAHLVFTERALIRWRSDFKRDGATRFTEVAGGLNQMTVGRFERIAHRSSLKLEMLEAVPIRRLGLLANRMTRECTTAVVRARLTKPG